MNIYRYFLAAITCIAAFTSCSQHSDNDDEKKLSTATNYQDIYTESSFENELNKKTRFYFKPKEKELIKNYIKNKAVTAVNDRDNYFFPFDSFIDVLPADVIKKYEDNAVNASIIFNRKVAVKGKIKDFIDGSLGSAAIVMHPSKGINNFHLMFWPNQREYVALYKKGEEDVFWCNRIERGAFALMGVGCITKKSLIDQITLKIENEVDQFEQGSFYADYIAEDIFFAVFMTTNDYEFLGCKKQKCSLYELNEAPKDEIIQTEIKYYSEIRLYEFLSLINEIYPENKLLDNLENNYLEEVRENIKNLRDVLLRNNISIKTIERG